MCGCSSCPQLGLQAPTTQRATKPDSGALWGQALRTTVRLTWVNKTKGKRESLTCFVQTDSCQSCKLQSGIGGLGQT